MTSHLGTGRAIALTLVAALLTLVPLAGQDHSAASAATPLTVAQAVSRQDGTSQTVRGYVVGQPTGTSTVLRSGFTDDYAIALADSASEIGTTRRSTCRCPARSARSGDCGLIPG